MGRPLRGLNSVRAQFGTPWFRADDRLPGDLLGPAFPAEGTLSATGVGVSWSLQGLWAAPWLTDVAELHRSAVVEHLTLLVAVLSASALLLGALAERQRREGVSSELFLVGTLALSMTAQLALLLGLPLSSHLLFAVIATAGATTVLSFALLLARVLPEGSRGPGQRNPRRSVELYASARRTQRGRSAAALSRAC